MSTQTHNPNTLPTLTVALPAYNEERTIEGVLRTLLRQKRTAFVLDTLVVYTDGCTDATVSIIKKLQVEFPELRLVENTVRRGKIACLNQMFADSTSDLLMILDADIGFRGQSFLDAFVSAAVRDDKSVMFAAHQVTLKPEGFGAKMYYAAFLMWDYIRWSVPDKDHVQNFYGAATIFRKRFLASAHIPDEINEDRTYLYLMAKKMGGFAYVDDAVIYHWPPHTAKDFATLRNRAFGSDTEVLQRLFGSEVASAGIIPRKYKISGMLRFCIEHPLYALPALFLNLRVSRDTKLAQSAAKPSRIWEIVSSTKKPMRKARVIFSNYDDMKNPVYAGGGAIAVHEIAKRLTDEFDVTVLTGNYPGAKNETIDSVNYRRIGPSYFVGRFAQLLFHFLLPFYALLLAYDLWIESFTPPFSTSFTPLFTRKPVIGLAHMLSGRDMRRKYRLPLEWIENIGLRRYKHFILLTDNSAEAVRRENPEADIVVIRNGVSAPALMGAPGSGNYLAYLGRIETDQKGLDLLLAAYAKLRETHAIPLHIAGSGSEKEIAHLKKLIAARGLTGSVTLRGRIEGAEKDAFLRDASIGIIPSRYETFSLTALEMMSYGLPVAAFSIPGIDWAPEDTLARVPAFDTDALAGVISKLLENKDFYNQISAHARTYAQACTWDLSARKYAEYARTVLDSKIAYE